MHFNVQIFVHLQRYASVTIRTEDNKRSVIVKVGTDLLSSFFSYSIRRTSQDKESKRQFFLFYFYD